MEARPAQRAAIRLAAAAAGAAVALGCVVATVVLAGWGRQTAPTAPADLGTALVSTTPTADAAWTDADAWPSPGARPASLPLADATPPATPASLDGDPLLSASVPAYEEPIAEVVPPAPSRPPAASFEPAYGGPLTIHNPAAFGPPEDDSIPPAPTFVAPRRVASTPSPRPQRVAARPASAGEAFGPSFTLPVAAEPATASLLEAATTEPAKPAAVQDQLAERLAKRPTATLRTLDQSDDALTPFTASVEGLSKRLEPQVRTGFQLGKAGAVYAARGEFVAVLRRVAAAKDAAAGGTQHAEALADGLRTLDDADDFVPRGDALEAELDVAAIARTHGVDLGADDAAPHEAVARYARHASRRLSEAAGNEPAASMALYGLGKTYARVEAQFGDAAAGRKAIVMYRAAVATHGENFLAANELGVHLARGGHYRAARIALRTAASQPGAIAAVHQNLAAIENRLGGDNAATVAASQAVRLAQQERLAGAASQRHGVTWVPPRAFSRSAPAATPLATPRTPTQQALTQPPTAPQMAAAAPQPIAEAPPQPPQQEKRGGWHGLVSAAKRATGWSSQPTSPTAVAPPGYGATRQAAAPMQRVVR
ncbi:MAG: hypothetical protein AAF805_02415 [Planctomycetota bacterium]